MAVMVVVGTQNSFITFYNYQAAAGLWSCDIHVGEDFSCF